MRLHIPVIAVCAMSILGCSKESQDATEQVDEAATTAADAVVAEAAAPHDESFLRHMHWHAEKLDELNFALEDGDLEGAGTSAYWLSRHDQVEGIPAELQPYLDGMRAAALAVEAATDLDAARAGAEQINAQCQACHLAAGVDQGLIDATISVDEE